MGSQTPLMSQYSAIKKEYPDSILFFRLGDFYEMFYDDAKTASGILGITLTSRNRSKENKIPLCGVPFHSAESYISKLLESGNKVAICEQVGKAGDAKSLVERKVVRVLTPGALLDSENLRSRSNNFLACVCERDGGYGLAFCDISTGEFQTSSFLNAEDLVSEFFRLDPSEILLPEGAVAPSWLEFLPDGGRRVLITRVDSWKWERQRCRETLTDGFGVLTLESAELEQRPGCLVACGILFAYLLETQKDFMPEVSFPKYYDTVDYMKIDEWTARNLELFVSAEGSPKNSLLRVMDITSCPMGARLLRRWMNYPLLDAEKIKTRQRAVAELVADISTRGALQEALRRVGDLERLIHRISVPSARPGDLAALRDSSSCVKNIKDAMAGLQDPVLCSLSEKTDDFSDLRDYLTSAVSAEPPVQIRDGGVVKKGFSSELDELREIQSAGKKWISDLEAEERKRTGINNLKVGYNRVFGYFFDVTKSKISLVPEEYSRRQTLAGSERFTSPRLSAYEEKILTARERMDEIEAVLFERIRKETTAHSARVKATAEILAEIDVFCSLAEAASRYDYCAPEFHDRPLVSLRGSRHPVVERMDLDRGFVPNDITLDSEADRFMIITGPNMSGKSTLIRQAALISLMAQMGSFVPASSANLGVVDRIFSRVGASDNLSRGQSTFMVEMVETAHILRNATEKSLVILDEIGRGTSTFDGMSIAWAVSEYLSDLGSITLFATHYHELANLADTRSGICNSNVMVKEQEGEILFLRKLLPGATSHSYGIQVARLAGVPATVLESARRVLFSLEKLKQSLSESMTGGRQLLLLDKDKEEQAEARYRKETLLSEELREIDPVNMTPMEALAKLAELKEKAGS